jgi:transcriptional antiterminator NusG
MTVNLGKWYALAVTPGREEGVRQRILDRLDTQGVTLKNMVMVIPEEEITISSVSGENKRKKRLSMPGYILLFTRELDKSAINTIVGAQGVFEFLGTNKSPRPLPNSEVDRLLGNVDKISPNADSRGRVFEINDSVRVIDGPLTDLVGNILEVNQETGIVHIEVEIFGRATPAELNVNQIKAE